MSRPIRYALEGTALAMGATEYPAHQLLWKIYPIVGFLAIVQDS